MTPEEMRELSEALRAGAPRHFERGSHASRLFRAAQLEAAAEICERLDALLAKTETAIPTSFSEEPQIRWSGVADPLGWPEWSYLTDTSLWFISEDAANRHYRELERYCDRCFESLWPINTCDHGSICAACGACEECFDLGGAFKG